MTDNAVHHNKVHEGLVDHKLHIETLLNQQEALSALLTAAESAVAVHKQRINEMCDTIAKLQLDIKELRNSLQVETNETNETKEANDTSDTRVCCDICT